MARETPAFDLTFPQEESEFIKQAYGEANRILEYGSGGSTRLAARLGKPCLSIESDAAWARLLNERLAADAGGTSTATVLHVDIGPTKEWGFPRNQANWKKFWRYPMAPWPTDEGKEPDLVLIDGRMRRACFAATMIGTRRKTRILFDDFGNRPHYHDVLAFAEPAHMVGRLAVFEIAPRDLARNEVAALIPWYFDLR